MTAVFASWAVALVESARLKLLTAEGESARRGGQWSKAVDAQLRAVALAETRFGDSVEAAVAAQNLAMTFRYTGRFADAEVLYLRALTLAESVGDAELVAGICHNLGGLAHARGDAAAGIPWARRSVAIREEGGEPLALAADRGALAGLLIDTGDLDEAAALLESARKVFVTHLGEYDYEVAVVDGNLATIALRRDDLPGAEQRACAALAGKERRLGSAHPELAVTLTTLGTVRRRRGDAAAAVELHRRALAVLTPVAEAGHPLQRAIEENLSVALEACRG